jgi:HAMP domain-containing protein
MSDHRHEPYEFYGTAATSGEVSHLESTVQGLRQDLSAAEDRIRDLENELDRQVRRLWSHLGNMPGGV